MNWYKLLAWGAVLSWAVFSAYYISTAKMKLKLTDLLLMMPQCCQMTDLVGSGYVVFSPETMIKFCFGFLLLYFVTWWITAEEVVGKTDTEVSKLVEYVETQILNDEETKEVLLDTSKSLVDKIDLEFQHCAALIAINNETPGQRVGGEVEWATGETSSEDDDATREIFGAHVKTPKQTQDEQILRSFIYPDEELTEHSTIKCVKEPNLKSLLSDDKCKTKASCQVTEVHT
ncbi:uncharacterized protein LOC128991013 [Macrosteles quadrilineatus]|uniref:uncharacterized protein LOC128991013 n=1 Tax=Macrosteles quadrilineatus TaxID=74068 RepID=UPI0023E19CCE|nr:uncharacterized protein LOC128991013 [Macrosteles quadrilineatus]